MRLRLLPVVELEPASLGVDDFIPLLDAGEWPAHWARLLSSWSLRPIQPGSWFVATSELTSPTAVDLLLRAQLSWDPAGGTPFPVMDELGPLRGGYTFTLGSAVQLEPGCCCDLSDLTFWASGNEGRATLAVLSIGHGNYTISTAGGITTVEVGSEVRGVAAIVLRYPAPDFELALVRAEADRRGFEALLEERLRALAVAEPAAFARRLAGGA